MAMMQSATRRRPTAVMPSYTLAIACFVLGLVSCAAAASSQLPQLLVQTKVSPGAYYHESIPVAVDVITRLGSGALALNDSVADPSVASSSAKWNVTHISDDAPMEDANYLAQFAAVAFVSTNDISPPNSGSILSNKAAAQFAKYIQNGGGFIGVHSASATMFTWPFYGRLVGAFFDYHPEIQPVGMRALNKSHPSTSRFPDLLQINEEVYHFRTDPRALPEPAQLLVSNGTTFKDPQYATWTRSDGPAPRPLAWWREGRLLDAPATPLGQGMDSNGTDPGSNGGGPGRMWYTSLGHANETWMNPYYQGHVAGGIGWVLASTTSNSSSSSGSAGSSSTNSSTAKDKSGTSGGMASGNVMSSVSSGLLLLAVLAVTATLL